VRDDARGLAKQQRLVAVQLRRPVQRDVGVREERLVRPERERARAAADLHGVDGSGLQRLKNLLELQCQLARRENLH